MILVVGQRVDIVETAPVTISIYSKSFYGEYFQCARHCERCQAVSNTDKSSYSYAAYVLVGALARTSLETVVINVGNI